MLERGTQPDDYMLILLDPAIAVTVSACVRHRPSRATR